MAPKKPKKESSAAQRKREWFAAWIKTRDRDKQLEEECADISKRADGYTELAEQDLTNRKTQIHRKSK